MKEKTNQGVINATTLLTIILVTIGVFAVGFYFFLVYTKSPEYNFAPYENTEEDTVLDTKEDLNLLEAESNVSDESNIQVIKNPTEVTPAQTKPAPQEQNVSTENTVTLQFSNSGRPYYGDYSKLESPKYPLDSFWAREASSEHLIPTYKDGKFYLRASDESDWSGLGVQIDIPEDAEMALFDMNFIKPGDGDFLSVAINNELVYQFLGTHYFPNEDNSDHESEILTFALYAGKTADITVVLIGAGTEEAEVTFSNFRMVKLQIEEDE